MRVQTRGGGEGGLTDGDLTISATSAICCEGNGTSVMPDGATAEAEKLEHLNAQAADFPHSPFACFSQCCPWMQHSWAASNDISAERARIPAPPTGSMATDRAMKAIRTARTMIMARSGLSAALPRGQVT